MIDLLTAIGLMFMLEGISYALFPDGMRRMMAMLQKLPPQQLRTAGLVVAIFGFLIMAVVRGY